jgi:alpha-1,6-mannosyltransferase
MFVIALFLFATSIFFFAQVGSDGSHTLPFILLTIVQYILYLYFLRYIFILKKSKPLKNGQLILITICAVVCMGAYLYFPPRHSNDIYRYLWDGLLVKSDVNPYQYVPSEWKLHDVQEANMPLYSLVDWRDKFSPYPPIAQYIFVIAHDVYLQWGIPGAKVIFALPTILSAALLFFRFDKLSGNESAAASLGFSGKKLYAAFILNPLLLLETIGSAHLDGWVIFFMLLGLYLYRQQKYIPSAIVWTLAIGTKVYPIIFVPFFVFDLLRRKKFREVSVSAFLFVGLLYFLYKPYISDSYFALTHYFTLPNEQEYNASFYRYMYLLLGDHTPNVYILATKICGIFFALLTIVLLFVKRYSYTLLLSVGILYLLFLPIVFPWYSLFLLPFILFQVYEKKDIKLIFLFAIVELLLTLIYFEPGKLHYREAMLNVEYFLILLFILFYAKFAWILRTLRFNS